MTKKQILNYVKKHKMDIQQAKVSLLGLTWAYEGYSTSRKIHTTPFVPVFAYFDRGGFTQIIEEDKLIEIGRWLYSEYQKNDKVIDKLMKNQTGFFKQIEKNFKLIKPGMSDKKILRIFKKLVRLSVEWWRYPTLGESKGKMIEELIIPSFAKNHQISNRKAHDIVYTLASGEQSAMTEERKMIYRVAIQVLKGKDRKEIFKEYKKEFFWMETDFYGTKEITFKSFVKRVKAEAKTHTLTQLLKELKKIEQERKKIGRLKKVYLNQFKLSQEEKREIRFVKKFMHLMELRKVEMMKQCYYLYTTARIMADRRGWDYDGIAFLTYKEFIESFLENKIDIDLINKRKKGTAVNYETEGKLHIIHDSDFAKKMLKTAKIGGKEVKKEVEGTVANTAGKNRIRGKARVVINPNRDKFNKGEILLTSMTRVEFVPLMKIAKAIVTDEGGMACHASIVSRELGIPCIVGTRLATAMFKSGDEVELELENGRVQLAKKVKV